MRLFCLAVFSVLFAGCVGLHEAPRVEKVALPNKTVAQAKSGAISYLVSQGWAPKQGDSLVTTFEKEAGGSAQFLYNEVGSSTTKDRFTLTILEAPNGSEIMGHLVMVYMRYGKPQESSTDLSNARGKFLLDCVRASILGEPIPEPPPRTNSPPVETRGATR